MIRRYIRRNLPNLILLLLLIILSIAGVLQSLINTNKLDNIGHIDILTINSIFIGFLFTTLGILVGFLGNRKIANSDKAGYMDEYYNTVYFGLFFFVTSAACSLLAIFINNLDDNPIILIIEQLTIMFGVAFFIKAIINLANIIKKIRNDL